MTNLSVTEHTPKISIIGPGDIGTELLSQLYNLGFSNNINRIINSTHCLNLEGGSLLNSKKSFYDIIGEEVKSGLSSKKAYKKLLEKEGEQYVSIRGVFSKQDIGDILIDTSNGLEKFPFLYHTLSGDLVSIATANKNPFVCKQESYDKIMKRASNYEVTLGKSATVMAGGPLLNQITELRDQGKEIESIKGCFSGSLGYIASELAKGRKFSEVLQVAVDNLYTEPDPKEDLSGFDVQRKLLILARESGEKLELDDINVESFVPQEYLELSKDELLGRASELDDDFEEKYKDAEERGKNLKYIASMIREGGSIKCRVGLEEVAKSSPIGSLDGTGNIAVITTSDDELYTKEKPLVIQKPGAGVSVTVSGVLSDLNRILWMNNILGKRKCFF